MSCFVYIITKFRNPKSLPNRKTPLILHTLATKSTSSSLPTPKPTKLLLIINFPHIVQHLYFFRIFLQNRIKSILNWYFSSINHNQFSLFISFVLVEILYMIHPHIFHSLSFSISRINVQVGMIMYGVAMMGV